MSIFILFMKVQSQIIYHTISNNYKIKVGLSKNNNNLETKFIYNIIEQQIV